MSAQSVRARLRDVVKDLLNTGTSPSRTAASVALGIAVGLSPFVGLQTLVVIVVAFVLGLNRVAALLASCIFNPWTAFPIVYLQIHSGAYLLGRPLPAVRRIPDSYDLDAFLVAIHSSMESYVAGGITIALLGGLLAYPAAYWGVLRVRSARADGGRPAELNPDRA